jgi:ABC-type multidrug transport system ATPase subunit
MQIIEDINNIGTTVLVATHAWDIVDNLQKRVIRLDRGVLVRDDEGGYAGEGHYGSGYTDGYTDDFANESGYPYED